MIDENETLSYQTGLIAQSIQASRNIQRFTEDFMFELDSEEYAGLRLQIATLKSRRGR